LRQKTKRHGVRFKMWGMFFIFSLVLMLVIWLLQVVFIRYFYKGEMAKETLSRARDIVELYEKGKLDENVISKNAYTNNIFIILTDSDGAVISAYDAMGEIGDKRLSMLNDYMRLTANMQEEIATSGKNEAYFYKDGRLDDNTFVYGAYSEQGNIDGGVYIYAISKLEPIDSVVAVIERQFVIILLIAFAFALLFAYIISQRFSSPIEKLTKSAKQLALGNNNVVFESGDSFGEIAELSNALNYAAEEISHSAQMRRELMANVSHDLRTPLTMIKMYAEMIRDITGDNKEKREKNLKIIIDETDRLSLLVNDILDLSRIEASGKEIDIKAFDIVNTAKNILERFSVMSEQGYEFVFDAPDKVYVLGDESRIEQVIYNLLSNAINYAGEDKKTTVHISNKFDCARIEIIDTGNGIPQEELANIWDRYYRSKTHIRSKVGTGLGLSIVKSILIAHNADFGIESTLGVGSNFWFELKLPENAANKTLRLADNNTVTEE